MSAYTIDTVREVLRVLGLDYESGSIVSVLIDSGKIAITTEEWVKPEGPHVATYTTTEHYYLND